MGKFLRLCHIFIKKFIQTLLKEVFHQDCMRDHEKKVISEENGLLLFLIPHKLMMIHLNRFFCNHLINFVSGGGMRGFKER